MTRWLVLVVCGICSAVSVAQIPRVLSYQGVLVGEDGRLLPDGQYRLTIRLYEQVSGGVPLHQEEQVVTTTGGVFSVLIGASTPLPPSLTFDRPYYVGVSVNGGAELQPRTMLVAVPYALRAEAAAVAEVAKSLAPEALKGLELQTPPSGAAGGDLSGSYPNPVIGSAKVTSAKLAANAVTTEKIAPWAVTGTKIHQMQADTGQVLTWIGSQWAPRWLSDSVWMLRGNSGTNPAVNFLGTRDNQPLVVRTNNVERLRVTATGNVGIGTNSPAALLHVAGTGRIDGTLTAAADLSVEGNTTLGDAAADQVTITAGTITVANIPAGSATDQVLLRNAANQVRHISAASLVSSNAWSLTGNSGTNPAVNFVGTTDAQPLVIRTNNAEQLRITPSGDVGIGTTTPAARLHVAGTGRIEGTLTAAADLSVEGNTTLGDAAADQVTITAGTITVANIPAGSATDQVLLRNAANQVRHISAASLVSSNAWSLTGNSGTNPATNFLGTTDGQPLVIRTSNTERLRITATGDMGIGTTTPAARLHVAGTGRIDGTLTAAADLSVEGNTTLGDAAADQVTITAGTITVANIPAGSATDQVLLRNAANQVRHISAASLVSSNAWSLTGNSGTNPATNFVGTTDGQPLVIRTSNTERLRITATGDMGIGTTTPAARLHVAGTGRIEGTLTAAADLSVEGNTTLGNAATDQVTITAGTITVANIPAGSASDQVLLRDGANQVRHIPAASLVSSTAWALTGNSGTNPAVNFVGTTDAQPLVIRTNNTERLRVTQTGNVGIGTSAPSARLHVVGGGGVEPLRVQGLGVNNSLGDVLVVDADGVVHRRSAATLGASNAWVLLGNSGTTAWNGTTGNYVGHSDAQPLVIATTNTTAPQPIQLWAGNQQVLQLNPAGNSAPAWSIQRDAGGNPRGLYAVDLQAFRYVATQVASGDCSTVGGGAYNTASGEYSTVGGGFANTASGGLSTVGGGVYNTASGDYSTVGGGFTNIASGLASTVGGGAYNTASGSWSTVGGGSANTASGLASTVGGGLYNTASGDYSTVGGGEQNTASGSWSTVGGGFYNTASGGYSVVVGGSSNTANANYVMVFGQNVDPSVTETHRVYLFGDGSGTGANANPSGFLVINRLDGDYPIHVGTNNTNGNGAYLSPGGTWTNASTRTKKDRFVSLPPQEVLAKIRQLPVEGWYYKGSSEYHIGPYAEDFHDAFGTGVLDGPDARTSLAASDVAGVALLGIKALAERVEQGGAAMQSNQADIEVLRRENAALQERIAMLEQKSQALEQENRELKQKDQELEQRLAALEQMVQELVGRSAAPQDPWLGENVPNPHEGTTTIPYRVPAGIATAVLRVHDAAGRQVLEVVLPARGQVAQVTLAIGSYPSGVYEYSLVLDGRVVATRQMHLVR